MQQRKIAFRAWDGLNKKMSFWTMNDLCTWADKEEKPNALDEWQQFTGLTDKNGREIYEGDVILFPNDDFTPENSKNPSVIGSVWYMDPVWKIKAVGEKGSYDMVDWGYGEQVDEFEIIGNVFEHPELISTIRK